MNTKKDYIPRGDANLDAHVERTISLVTENAETWGIQEKATLPLQEIFPVWRDRFTKTRDKEHCSRVDIVAKNEAKKLLIKELRLFTNAYLVYNPNITIAEKEGLGLNIRPGVRTPVPAPTSAPLIVRIDINSRFRHTLHIVDEETGKKAKPKSAAFFEVWYSKSELPPENEKELFFVGSYSSSPCYGGKNKQYI